MPNTRGLWSPAIAATAGSVNSALIKIANEIYSDPSGVDQVEKEMRKLLT